ncbi:hypothetical protein [Novosphingobium sp. PhB55]|uniref:hypothetical protein n=1 Tax=Novosphingobium sp. PhB55 TaxID=2485106 RepID=UPI0010663AAF|nr:hypothetical protein [Novosphingobium sp. PhB55]
MNEAPKGAFDQLVDACRTVVQAELQCARIAYFAMHADRSGSVVCEVSGDRISERNCGLEYAGRGFSELVGDFALAQGWQDGIPEGALSAPADAQTTTSFASPPYATAFREFHRTTARVRVVSKKIVTAHSLLDRGPNEQQRSQGCTHPLVSYIPCRPSSTTSIHHTFGTE